MNTTALAIITAAYRESNLVPMGQPLNANQIAEALPRLNSLLASVVGFEVGERLQDWPIGSIGIDGGLPGWSTGLSNSPPANVRLMVNDNQAHTVSMPHHPANGSRIGIVDGQQNFSLYPLTLNGNGRRINGDPSYVINTDGFTGEFIYREESGSWEAVAVLTEVDEMPYPIQHDDVFITLLAMRLNPRYGRAVSAETKFTLDRSLNQLRASHRQRRPVRSGLPSMTTDRYPSDWGGGRIDPYNPGDGY